MRTTSERYERVTAHLGVSRQGATESDVFYQLASLTSVSIYANLRRRSIENHAIPPQFYLLVAYEQKKLGQKRRGTTVDVRRHRTSPILIILKNPHYGGDVGGDAACRLRRRSRRAASCRSSSSVSGFNFSSSASA